VCASGAGLLVDRGVDGGSAAELDDAGPGFDGGAAVADFIAELAHVAGAAAAAVGSDPDGESVLGWVREGSAPLLSANFSNSNPCFPNARMTVSELIVAVMNLQCTSKLPQSAVLAIFDLLRQLCPDGHLLPTYYHMKKAMPSLGLFVMGSVDVCINGCVIFGPSIVLQKNRPIEECCPRCSANRYEMARPRKVHFSCIIHVYACMNNATTCMMNNMLTSPFLHLCAHVCAANVAPLFD